MSRRMSCSMTVDAVLDRRKTVTRRHVDTWRTLKPGDRLTLIEKGMGLPKGARQVVLAEVEVVDVRVEPILGIEGHGEIRREGFDPDEWLPIEWATWWAGCHGYSIPIRPRSWWPVDPSDLEGVLCRRIEWHYLDACALCKGTGSRLVDDGPIPCPRCKGAA